MAVYRFPLKVVNYFIVFNSLTDLFLAFFPLDFIWRLNMKISRKLVLVILLCSGGALSVYQVSDIEIAILNVLQFNRSIRFKDSSSREIQLSR